MALVWSDSLALIDWNELSRLYLLELGPKKPADLKVVFSNSRFGFFVYDGGHLIGTVRAVSDGVDFPYIFDGAVHPDYQGQGISKEIVGRVVENGLTMPRLVIAIGAMHRKARFSTESLSRRVILLVALTMVWPILNSAVSGYGVLVGVLNSQPSALPTNFLNQLKLKR